MISDDERPQINEFRFVLDKMWLYISAIEPMPVFYYTAFKPIGEFLLFFSSSF